MSSLPPPSPTDRPAPIATEHEALAPGTRFGELEILRVLGVGGFGIVYLAMDHSLQREVALKEYMPAALATRGAGPQITIRSGSFSETYAIGLRSFVNEARLLARFDHPSLVKVYRFWEDNATAYMVMPYVQGRTLRDRRRESTGSPDETWLRALLEPLLGAVEQLHREGVFHRDIAPDNILLQRDGTPVLLDFGAARHVISDRTQTLTAILKPSYAPIEQYADMTQLRQGPWTDIYALGAVLHYALLGAPPPPATARALEDELVPLSQRHFPGVSQRFLLAIDWALSVRPAQRPQDIDAFRAALQGRAAVPAELVQRVARPAPESASAPAAFETTLVLGRRPTVTEPAHTDFQATLPMESRFQATLPVDPTVPLDSAPATPSRPAREASAASPTSRPATNAAPPPQDSGPMPAGAQGRGDGSSPRGRTPASQPAEPMITPLPPSTAKRAEPAAAEPRASGSVSEPTRERKRPPAETAAPAPTSRRSSQRVVALASGVVAVAIAAGLGWQFGASRDRPPAQGAPAVAQPDAPPLAPAPAAPVQAAALPPVGENPAATSAPAAPPPAAVAPAAVAAPAPQVSPAIAEAVAPKAVSPAAARPKPVVAGASPKPRESAAAVQAAPARSVEPAVQPMAATPAVAVPSVAAVPPRAAAPAVAPPVAPAPASPVPDPAAPTEPKTAREACGKRVLVALWQCMERECEKPRYRDHPQCVEALATKRARERG